MEYLFEKFLNKLDRLAVAFSRYLLSTIDWNNRMIGIKGARGTGKTTLLLQYAYFYLPHDHRTLYVSLDDFYFTEYHIVELVREFVLQGGRYLLLDEVHRYPSCSTELKNIYDDYPDLQVIFTGSSVLHINKARADLSRRAVMYELPGLSYREFLNLKFGYSFSPVAWQTLVTDHTAVARKIKNDIRPLEYFQPYLNNGYYPYFMDNEETYTQKLKETIELAIHVDLPSFFDISHKSLEKLRKLLFILSGSAPFTPNVKKLSERMGVTRNTLIEYLGYLEELRVIKRLYTSTKGVGLLQKPDKLMIYHPNFHYALSQHPPETGSIRESFFVNQVSQFARVRNARQGDFQVDVNVFEIGGKKKTNRQVQDVSNAFVVSDDIEIGVKNKIPLWLFGFLY
jgi:predicted AAA+ superfamily ATPase